MGPTDYLPLDAGVLAARRRSVHRCVASSKTLVGIESFVHHRSTLDLSPDCGFIGDGLIISRRISYGVERQILIVSLSPGDGVYS